MVAITIHNKRPDTYTDRHFDQFIRLAQPAELKTKFLDQGFQKLEHEQRRHTYAHRRDRKHYDSRIQSRWRNPRTPRSVNRGPHICIWGPPTL